MRMYIYIKAQLLQYISLYIISWCWCYTGCDKINVYKTSKIEIQPSQPQTKSYLFARCHCLLWAAFISYCIVASITTTRKSLKENITERRLENVFELSSTSNTEIAWYHITTGTTKHECSIHMYLGIFTCKNLRTSYNLHFTFRTFSHDPDMTKCYLFILSP